jgi:hypothetical protein
MRHETQEHRTSAEEVVIVLIREMGEESGPNARTPTSRLCCRSVSIVSQLTAREHRNEARRSP